MNAEVNTALSANGAEYDSQGQATKERRPWINACKAPSPVRAKWR
jgi:hypothetical protein